jgi:hypothetical protein
MPGNESTVAFYEIHPADEFKDTAKNQTGKEL